MNLPQTLIDARVQVGSGVISYPHHRIGGPVDELLGGTPDLVWQRALTVHARFGHELWSAVLVRRSR